ncbi:MAG: DNA repair protein RecN [Ignavibacteriae bacterium]|nr:DNA repair protein RecN [Ignavibacteriota bacterium]
MLKSLLIKNFALIDSLEIDFSEGLNIITGETGAGKSVIVEALLMALGERASVDLIREGEKKAIIEAIFNLQYKSIINTILTENEIDINNDIIIRREISDKSSSRCFINDSPVNLNVLKKIGDLLVDFHGQHDHQLLLNRESHITLLDSLANIENLKSEYFSIYSSLIEKIRKITELKKNELQLKSKTDALKFELNEIERVNPLPDEENLLEQELNLIQNSEILHNLANELNMILSEDENSAYSQLNKSEKILQKLVKIDSRYKEYYNEIIKASVSITEIIKFSNNYLSQIQFDQERIESIRERLLILTGLRKKYGNYNAIFEKKSFIESELNHIINFDEEIISLDKEISDLKNKAGEKAFQISEKRKNISIKLDKSVVLTLKNLGIENSFFKTVITQNEINKSTLMQSGNHIHVNYEGKSYSTSPDGIDDVEFFISTNKGETPKPLTNVASGGEISRVMLALKSILAESDNLPILIFDEIDIGISGRIAQKVGITMKELSKKHQIISITHLPQIAALGDSNIRVEKITVQGRTLIKSNIISNKEKVKEIARLISGETITETSLKTATELINFEN